MEVYIGLLGLVFSSGTALAIAALGLLINEKAGIVNLGAEGMMLCAAIAGFAAYVHTQNPWAGFLAGAAAGAVLAALFGVLVIWLNTNQYATGLALSLFGVGFSAFVGINYVQAKAPGGFSYALPLLGDLPWVGPALFRHHPLVYLTMVLALSLFGVGFSAFAGISYVQAKLPETPKFSWPGLSDLPLLGPALGNLHPLVYATMLLAAAMVWFLYRTRAGLVLRSVGESPESAHALGYPVRRIRLAAVAAGGALCGLAGAYISTVYTPLWVEGMVAGRGWIALALTTFATWRPARVLLGAYLFGGVTMLQFHLQGQGVQIASQFLTMLPYLATIVVLVLISRNPTWIRVNMPASLGKPFHPGS